MLRLFWLAVIACGLTLAQPVSPVRITPDCGPVNFALTAAGQLQTFNPPPGLGNLQNECNVWIVSYNSTGFSALSLAFQSAPDSSGAPGTFVTFTGVLVSGSNPNTATTNATTNFTGNLPWVRVNLTSVTGTGKVTGNFYGYHNTPANAGGIGPVNVAQINGTTIFGCPSKLKFNVTTSGDNQIIPLSGTLTTYICALDFSGASSFDWKLTSGTGANCVTGNQDETGLYKNVVAYSSPWAPFDPLVIPAGKATCFNISANVVTGGTVVFGQQD